MSCAPPNAVYGIETVEAGVVEAGVVEGCAPPNAVYGIETYI